MVEVSSGVLVVLAVMTLVIALNAAGLVVGFRKLRRAQPGVWRTLGWVVWTSLMLFSVCGLVGTVLGMVMAFGAVGGESIDPSQKARILAEGISEAMNLTAFGVLLLLPLALGFLIYRAVARWRAAKVKGS